MYLLDNYKKNVSKDILENINNLNNFNDLIKQSSSDFGNGGMTNYFSKISNFSRYTVLNASIINENMLNNVCNLFLSPPLSMNEDSEEYKEILNGINKNLKDSFYENISFRYFVNGKSVIDIYMEKLNEFLKDNTTTSSYDIVGQVTKNFSKLFYGKKIFSKNDMDGFLFDVEQKNNLKTELNFTSQNIDELKLLANDLNIEFDENNLEKTFKNLSMDLTKQSTNNSLNVSYNLNYNLREINKRNKTEIFSLLKNELTEKEYDLLENKSIIPKGSFNHTSKYLLKNLKKYEKELGGASFNSFTLFFTDLEAFNLKRKLKAISEKIENKINETEKFLVVEKTKIYEEYNKDLNVIKYNDNLKRFQDLNKIFSQSKTIEYNRHILNVFIEKQNYGNFGKSEKNEFKHILKEILKNFKNKDDYKINDIKQFLYISLSNNKTIYDLYKNTNFLQDIGQNKFIQDLINKKITIELNEFDVNRLKYVFNILLFDKNIEKLFQSEINIDIKNVFYKQLNLTTESEKGEETLNNVFSIFQEKSKIINMKENNILILMILYSYENSVFNDNKFNELYNLFKKPLNKLDRNDKELINQIDDKWFKWSLLIGREVQNKNLIQSSINPIEFEFNKIETLKKIIQDIKPKDELNKYDLNFIHLVSKYSKSSELEITDYFKKFNENMINNKSHNYIYMFNRNLSIVLNNKNELIENKLKNLFLTQNNFDKLVEEINKLSTYSLILKDPKIKEFNLSNEKLYNLSAGNKDVIKSMLKIEDVDLFNEILKNIHDIPKMSETKFNNYINYYKEMSQTETFKNFKESDCEIPLISKDMENGYSYRIKTIKDFDILLTGEKTNCCMTIKESSFGNGAGFSIYGHMYNHPKTNAIFEVCKNGKTIANSWVWRKDEQICFDNIEVLGKDIRKNISNCYRDASLNFIDKDESIELVTFGVSNSDIDTSELGNNIVNKNYNSFDFMNVYTDSYNQKAIATTNPFILDIKLMLYKLKDSNIDENLINNLNDKINKNLDNIDLKIKVNETKKIQPVTMNDFELDF